MLKAPDLLKAWLTIETLSPESSSDRGMSDSRVHHSSVNPAPWLFPSEIKEDEDTTVFWELRFGALELVPASDVIMEAFPDETPNERRPMRGHIPLAILLLDAKGYMVAEKGAVSSFAWAVGKLRAQDSADIEGFAEIEPRILDVLQERLAPKNTKRSLHPLTEHDLKAALMWFVEELNLDSSLTQLDWQTRRIVFRKANADPPEIGLLNSFFLKDLATVQRAVKKRDIGPALEAYLSDPHFKKRRDIVADRTLLKNTLHPSRFPVARWPGFGRHPLVLMQQAAVNHAFHELEPGGLIAVNGPPGTGKTTLLRDVIAGIVARRAVAMCSFKDPEEAFTHAPGKNRSNAKEHRYLIDEALLGFEIVVASSNNKAVENISKEVPAIGAVADDFPEPLRYFSSVSDQLMASDENPDQGFMHTGTSWGLVAAVTGNAKKRNGFIDVFWWKNFKDYLWAIDGATRTHPIVDAEKPPLNHAHALLNWKKAQSEFLENLKIYEDLVATFKQVLASRARLPELEQELEHLEKDVEEIRSSLKAAKFEVLRSATETPPASDDGTERKAQREQKRLQARRSVMKHRKILHDALARGLQVPDDVFWSRDDETFQTLSPWSCPLFDRARDNLFVTAFKVHRAFIDGAAKPLRHNLGALFKHIASNFKGVPSEMRQSLWSSLFFVVPVLSTTFASFGRQFAGLDREQIGWLLVDEAGQATPQAAIGALWRSKRAMIIGDPLQIEPVTSLPNALISSVFDYFGVSAEDWAAPFVSAQVLADRASWFGTIVTNGAGSLWVGSPLRVHRRCEEPMFSVANRAAYDGLMVQATRPAPSPIGSVWGESVWFDVPSVAIGKWQPAEAVAVIDSVKELHYKISSPDLFIITPFRDVAMGLWRQVGETFPPDIANRLRSRIGTVHTFQGKEAEAVILLLGAGGPDSEPARRWAGSRVNILNVAVTRAKKRLYVVGDFASWSEVPFFQELANVLPRRK